MNANLIAKLREGDHNSFKEIYELYHYKVYRFINRFTDQSTDTEDIVQNVFIHLWEYREYVPLQTPAEAVLFKASKQEIYKWYKKQGNFPLLTDGLLREDTDTEYEYEEIDAHIQEIHNLLEKIPEKRRQIFKLHTFEKKTYKEIAAQMAMTPGAVAKQISRTLQYLREHTPHDPLILWMAYVLYFSQ